MRKYRTAEINIQCFSELSNSCFTFHLLSTTDQFIIIIIVDIYWVFTTCQALFLSASHILSQIYNTMMYVLLPPPLFRWENVGPERFTKLTWSHIAKVTEPGIRSPVPSLYSILLPNAVLTSAGLSCFILKSKPYILNCVWLVVNISLVWFPPGLIKCSLAEISDSEPQ